MHSRWQKNVKNPRENNSCPFRPYQNQQPMIGLQSLALLLLLTFPRVPDSLMKRQHSFRSDAKLLAVEPEPNRDHSSAVPEEHAQANVHLTAAHFRPWRQLVHRYASGRQRPRP